MSSSSNPAELTVQLPTEVYELILLAASQSVTEQITRVQDLPQNGEARKNRLLASLLTLDSTSCNFLTRLTWNRLGLSYDIGKVQHDSEYFLDLQRKFQDNNPFTKVIDIQLSCIPDGDEVRDNALENQDQVVELIQIFTQILNTAYSSRIEKVLLHLDHLDNQFLIWDGVDEFELAQEDVDEELRQSIDGLMSTITSFVNLIQFEWVSTKFTCVSEECLGWIISHLPNLETVSLSCAEYSIKPTSQKNIDLGISLASREKLRTLVLQNLNTIKKSWLDLKWQGELQELTIEVIGSEEDSLCEENVLKFCHLFHRSLTGLYLATSFQELLIHSERDEALTLDFGFLKFLAFDGGPADLRVLGMLPNVEVLFWKNLDGESPDTLSDFASFLDGNRWSQLKTIVLQPCSGNEPLIPEILVHHCMERDIEICFSNPADIASLWSKTKIADLLALLGTSSRIQSHHGT